MKTIFFFLAMLASVVASAQVTHVEPVSANYTNKTVSFRVWWNAGSRDATYLSKVWVWVDYITVNSNNTTSGNTWTRATIGTISGGVTSYDGSNRKGFWLEGNASAAYSATLTVQLTNVPAKFNWCAYVSDYPPNVTLDKGTYIFKGTTNFIVSSHAQPITTKTITRTSLTVTSSSTFTDATGCPGIGSLYCPYTGSDLYMDPTHLCQQRTSGAQNWEAYIKDTRDDELYRIVLMPDNQWWLAQNLKYAGTGSTNNSGNCTKDLCGRWYTATQANGSYGGTSGYGTNIQGACPNGWVLPVTSTWQAFSAAISGTNATVCQRIRATSYNSCTNGNDYYGWASIIPVFRGDGSNTELNWGEVWRTNAATGYEIYVIDHALGTGRACGIINYTSYLNENDSNKKYAVRCFRKL